MSTDDKVIPLDTGYVPGPRQVNLDDIHQLHFTVAELANEIKELSIALSKLTRAHRLFAEQQKQILEHIKAKT